MDRSLSDSWTGFTKFSSLNKEPLQGFVVQEGTFVVQATTEPEYLWPGMSKAAQKKKKKQEWAIILKKPKHDNARKLKGIYFIDPRDAQGKSWKF